MTKAAKAYGKQLQNFWNAQATKDVIGALEASKGNSLNSNEFVQTSMGRNGGTWAHPDLAIEFARWLDPKFAVWCNAVIKDILTGAAQVTIVKPEQSAVMALPQDYSSALRALADAVDQQLACHVRCYTDCVPKLYTQGVGVVA